MTAWERMEDFLFSWETAGHHTFTVHDVAHVLEIRPNEASNLIDAYQEAVSKPRCNTLFALRREGRTSAATWHIGVSTKDARAIAAQFADDVERAWERRVGPMQDQIMERNPRTMKQVRTIERRMGGLLDQLRRLADPT